MSKKRQKVEKKIETEPELDSDSESTKWLKYCKGYIERGLIFTYPELDDFSEPSLEKGESYSCWGLILISCESIQSVIMLANKHPRKFSIIDNIDSKTIIIKLNISGSMIINKGWTPCVKSDTEGKKPPIGDYFHFQHHIDRNFFYPEFDWFHQTLTKPSLYWVLGLHPLELLFIEKNKFITKAKS